MTIAEIVSKFASLESQVAQERGNFTLFALFMREDVPDRWDLIISAPWVINDKEDTIRYFVDRIKATLGDQGLTNLSRIVLVDPDDIAVQNLNRAIHVEHGSVEVRDSNFFGLPIKHAYIITSKRPPAPAPR